MKVTGFCYALVVQRREEEDMSIPVEAAKALEEYVDVIQKELPNGLPPKRDFQHHIDLIPGASLPNQEAYRMSPTQHAEISKQVIGLIKEGVVRESMSLLGSRIDQFGEGSIEVKCGEGRVSVKCEEGRVSARCGE